MFNNSFILEKNSYRMTSKQKYSPLRHPHIIYELLVRASLNYMLIQGCIREEEILTIVSANSRIKVL